jgi:hypothetical protein
MGLRLRQAEHGRLPELRYEPTEKRIRVLLGDQVIADTTRAVLVWEPRRLVPSYAVPVDELRATLERDEQTTQDDSERLPHPGIGFATHCTPLRPSDRSTGSRCRTRCRSRYRPLRTVRA